jgi:hypothetical protein
MASLFLQALLFVCWSNLLLDLFSFVRVTTVRFLFCWGGRAVVVAVVRFCSVDLTDYTGVALWFEKCNKIIK